MRRTDATGERAPVVARRLGGGNHVSEAQPF